MLVGVDTDDNSTPAPVGVMLDTAAQLQLRPERTGFVTLAGRRTTDQQQGHPSRGTRQQPYTRRDHDRTDVFVVHSI